MGGGVVGTRHAAVPPREGMVACLPTTSSPTVTRSCVSRYTGCKVRGERWWRGHMSRSEVTAAALSLPSPYTPVARMREECSDGMSAARAVSLSPFTRLAQRHDGARVVKRGPVRAVRRSRHASPPSRAPSWRAEPAPE